MRDLRSRAGILVGVVAGAVGAAAMISATTAPTARADNEIFTPDTSTFDPTSALGYPPFDNVLQGTEQWDLANGAPDQSIVLSGVDTQTTIGSFTNDDFLQTSGTLGFNIDLVPVSGSQFDLMNFGGGFENEWVSFIPNLGTTTITDTLITPFGDFTLF